jgi:hypothetical protein
MTNVPRQVPLHLAPTRVHSTREAHANKALRHSWRKWLKWLEWVKDVKAHTVTLLVTNPGFSRQHRSYDLRQETPAADLRSRCWSRLMAPVRQKRTDNQFVPSAWRKKNFLQSNTSHLSNVQVWVSWVVVLIHQRSEFPFHHNQGWKIRIRSMCNKHLLHFNRITFFSNLFLPFFGRFFPLCLGFFLPPTNQRFSLFSGIWQTITSATSKTHLYFSWRKENAKYHVYMLYMCIHYNTGSTMFIDINIS